jgi:hypothetical protein
MLAAEKYLAGLYIKWEVDTGPEAPDHRGQTYIFPVTWDHFGIQLVIHT